MLGKVVIAAKHTQFCKIGLLALTLRLLASLIRAWLVLMNKRIDAGCSYRDGPCSCSGGSWSGWTESQSLLTHYHSLPLSFLFVSDLIGREFLVSLVKT